MSLNLIPPTNPVRAKKGRIGSLVLRKAKEPKKLIYIISFLVGVLLIFGFYFIIKNHQKSLVKEIARLENENIKRDEEKRELMKNSEVSNFQNRLSVIEQLIKGHLEWVGVLDFLEKRTMPKVQYQSFGCEIGSKTIRVSGITPNFTSLAEQIIILKKQPLIKSFKLSSFSMKDEGIGFSFEIMLAPEVWQKSSDNKNNES